MPTSLRTQTQSNLATKLRGVAAGSRPEILAEAERAIDRLRRLAERPACIILLGEPNSGKTTLANRLLAGKILPTSIIPNTRYPVLLRHGKSVDLWGHTTEANRVSVDNEFDVTDQAISFLEITMPNPRLLEFEVLDTPAHFEPSVIDRVGERASLRIPVWCTSATQAWKESERQAWLRLRGSLRRPGVLALTRLDLIVGDEQRRRLLARLEAEAGPYFHQIVQAVDPDEDGPSFTDQFFSLAGRLRERRRRTIALLSGRINRLAKNSGSEVSTPCALGSIP